MADRLVSIPDYAREIGLPSRRVAERVRTAADGGRIAPADYAGRHPLYRRREIEVAVRRDDPEAWRGTGYAPVSEIARLVGCDRPRTVASRLNRALARSEIAPPRMGHAGAGHQVALWPLEAAVAINRRAVTGWAVARRPLRRPGRSGIREIAEREGVSTEAAGKKVRSGIRAGRITKPAPSEWEWLTENRRAPTYDDAEVAAWLAEEPFDREAIELQRRAASARRAEDGFPVADDVYWRAVTENEIWDYDRRRALRLRSAA